MRYIITKKCPSGQVGEIFVVVGSDPRYPDILAVRFDEENCYRHDCGGRTDDGHGWWVQEEMLYRDCEPLHDEPVDLSEWM